MTHPSSFGHGLSTDRLARIDSLLQTRYLDTGRLPCAVTLVERRGQLAHHSTLGYMDVERQRAVQNDTIFRIYSMTKPLTSVAFMMLVEEGLVALDDPVHRFIPQWRDLGVYEAGFLETFRTRRTSRPMRMIDLLRHTSGLTYDFQQRTNVDAAYRKHRLGEIGGPLSLDGMIDGLAKMPLEFSPGDSWNYSVATDVLGYLVGKIAGMPFEQFLKQRILAPLEMHDTDFHVPESKASRFAACYRFTADQSMRLVDDPHSSPYLRQPTFVSGGGGLVSTMSDYLRFCRMLLNGGSLNGVRLLSPKTLELMTMNHLPNGKDLTQLSISLFSEATYSGVGFGLGFSVTLDPARTLLPGTAGDFSWGGMASTYFWIDPREELIVIFMTQLMPSATYPLRRELRTLVYSAFE
ncbi:MAG TPA: serine hydrolase domain-containing protein [Steroidobacteraceae bacterium]|nr:serine hydrolase domain-containing protein [Steroidobacteraceae bacterium]